MSDPLKGVDTNILVRLLLRDDKNQYGLTLDLLKSVQKNDPLILNPVVLAELNWLLEKRLRMATEQARDLALRLIESVEFQLPEKMSFANVADWYASAHKDFSDIIIANINKEFGCSSTLTFDKRAARNVPGMELLA